MLQPCLSRLALVKAGGFIPWLSVAVGSPLFAFSDHRVSLKVVAGIGGRGGCSMATAAGALALAPSVVPPAPSLQLVSGMNPPTCLRSALAASHSPGSPLSFLVGSPRFRAAGRAVGPIAAAGALVAAAYAAFRKCEPGLYTPILPNPIESS
jgi:hypothetical protein